MAWCFKIFGFKQRWILGSFFIAVCPTLANSSTAALRRIPNFVTHGCEKKHWGQGLRETQPLHDIAWQADTNIAMMYRTIFSGLLSLVLSTVICRRFWFLSLIRHSSPPAGTITGSTWKHDRQNNIIGKGSWVGTPGTPVIERSNVLRCFLMSSKSVNVMVILQS